MTNPLNNLEKQQEFVREAMVKVLFTLIQAARLTNKTTISVDELETVMYSILREGEGVFESEDKDDREEITIRETSGERYKEQTRTSTKEVKSK
jgi:hypothetical protein